MNFSVVKYVWAYKEEMYLRGNGDNTKDKENEQELKHVQS